MDKDCLKHMVKPIARELFIFKMKRNTTLITYIGGVNTLSMLYFYIKILDLYSENSDYAKSRACSVVIVIHLFCTFLFSICNKPQILLLHHIDSTGTVNLFITYANEAMFLGPFVCFYICRCWQLLIN